jgi:hypothetical protein
MAKGRERTQKFYFKNEAEVMRDLGLEPTKGSGSSWIEKEDGENDFVLAQLKSTDKQSYKLSQLDIEKLEYHAMVSNKIPMFVLQFLNKDSRYALVAIEDIPKLAEYINTGEIKGMDENHTINIPDVKQKKPKKKIKSSKSAREQFFKEKEEAWENRKYK